MLTDKEEAFCALNDMEKLLQPLSDRGVPVLVVMAIPGTRECIHLLNPHVKPNVESMREAVKRILDKLEES